MGNMYKDRKYSWALFVGCRFDCSYCKPSFQAILKRWTKPYIDKDGNQKGCQLCYEYNPHFHEKRLNNKLPRTKGDEFIWIGGSGDISFISDMNMEKILKKLKKYPDRTFFFQTKNPKWFQKWDFPENVLLGTTIETNYWSGVYRVSDAPITPQRYIDFLNVKHPRKCITIEPIMFFDLFEMVEWCVNIKPERIYIGYDSKQCYLKEPTMGKTLLLINELRLNLPECKIKEKSIRPAWDEK